MKKHLLLAALVLFFVTGIASSIEAQTKKPVATQTATTGDKIYACYHKINGQLRKVNRAGQCKPAEIEISWNIVGPQGKPGPQGPKGNTGPAGPQGPPGEGLSDHHQELRFSLSPTESRTFSLPKNDVPVRIEISTSNVPVSFNGKTYNLGPFLLQTIASFDSTAGIGRISANGLCSDGTLCESLSYNVVPPTYPNDGVIFLVLAMNDTSTGALTVSIRPLRNDFLITTSQINYVVSMWY